MGSIERIGLIANEEKPQWRENLTQSARWIREAGRVALAPQIGLGAEVRTDRDERDISAIIRIIEQTDLVLVIGGDGTMLHAAREIRVPTTPVMGINTGNLGFLTAAPMGRLAEVLDRLWKGDYEMAWRPFLEAGVVRDKGMTERRTALNDFVINRRELSRMVQMRVRVDSRPLTTYQCDGLIVCTPTGSTAYSLSAGGPIINPDCEVMAITPICPHALSNRTVIVPLDSVVEVEIGDGHPETVLSGDGQDSFTLSPGSVVRIRRSERRLHFLSVGGIEFFQTLREKMKWSGTSF